MGKLLCEKNLRDVWCRNESVRAEIGHILQTHRQTHASKLVVEMLIACEVCLRHHLIRWTFLVLASPQDEVDVVYHLTVEHHRPVQLVPLQINKATV